MTSNPLPQAPRFPGSMDNCFVHEQSLFHLNGVTYLATAYMSVDGVVLHVHYSSPLDLLPCGVM